MEFLLGLLQATAHFYTEVLFFILFSTITSRLACQLRKSYWLHGEELFEFRKHYERSSGNPISFEYLHRAQVRGYRARDGTLAGGFILNAQAPLRYFEMLNDNERVALAADEALFVELACIWMNPKLVGYCDRFRIYLESILFAVRTGKPRLLAGTFADGVRRQQMVCMPHLYQSVVSSFRGSPQQLWLYYGYAHAIGPKLCRFLLSVTILDALAWLGLPVAHPSWSYKRKKRSVEALVKMQAA